MSTTQSLTGHTVIRVGLFGRDAQHKRWMCSETWVRPGSAALSEAFAAYSLIWPQMLTPFGTSIPSLTYTSATSFYDYLFPRETVGFYRSSLAVVSGPLLNVNAPEASFRLQRVGADGAATFLGRITYPIRTDTFYTDLPHRRHLNLAVLEPLRLAAQNSWFKTLTLGGLTWVNSIIHRRTMTWTPLTSWRLLANPVRVWQRWRNYPEPGHVPAQDILYHPSELL